MSTPAHGPDPARRPHPARPAGRDDAPDHPTTPDPTTRPSPGPGAAYQGRRGTASSPAQRLLAWARPWPVQALGWLLVVLACYPTLWDRAGKPLFKLDAWVYRHAVLQWHASGSLYDWYANPDQHLWPFTYPPFAAWALTPLTWLDDRTAQVLMVAATPACVAVTAWAVARCLGAGRDAVALAPWAALAGVAVIEPVYKSMEYGQVNAQLMVLVALDLLVVPASSRWRGVLSGLAAAFKLTPAIAVLVLLARREWRAAATMTATAAGVTALAWVISPGESVQFFFSAMWDPGRAGFADYSGNQNLKGLVSRALPEAAWTPVWALAVLACLAGACLLLLRLERVRARREAAQAGQTQAGQAQRGLAAAQSPSQAPTRGDATGMSDAALVLLLEVSVVMATGLLISPISWSHHWVWVMVVLPALLLAGRRWEAPALTACAVAGAAVFILAMQWWFPQQNHVEQAWPVWARVAGSSYTLWALVSGVALGRFVAVGGSER